MAEETQIHKDIWELRLGWRNSENNQTVQQRSCIGGLENTCEDAGILSTAEAFRLVRIVTIVTES